MKKWTQIEQINSGDIVQHYYGEIEVLSIRVNNTMAYMTWKWKNAKNHYYSSDFRKSTNFIDYGFWHNLTSQQWKLEK
jgi:hypothetical protein